MINRLLTQILSLVIIILGENCSLAVDKKLDSDSGISLPTAHSFDIKMGSQADLNNWVALNGAEIYHYLNNHHKISYPKESKNLQFHTESEDWVAHSPHGGNQIDFIKKEGVPASKAIQSLLASGGQFDCRIAQGIVFLECMRRLIGDVIFDQLATQFETELSEDLSAKKGETRKLHLCGSKVLNPYIRLTTQENGSLYKCGGAGYFGYIPNIEEYAILHPYGFLRGDHGFICSNGQKNSEDKLYVGFGSFYKEGGLRWADVVSRFKKETLTPSSFDDTAASENRVPPIRSAARVEALKRLRAEAEQQKKIFVTNLQDTYEDKLKQRQIEFREISASYFISIEFLKALLR